MSVFFEDVVLGARTLYGSHAFTAEEILSFARRYDPQRFHVDEAAARETWFGGLCASGWHTATACVRVMAEHQNRAAAEIAAAGGRPARLGPSPGIRDLKWLKPVYPGDVVTYRGHVAEKRELADAPGWGLLVTLTEGVNQKDELVISFLAETRLERRARAANG